jgi:hypothetical protein
VFIALDATIAVHSALDNCVCPQVSSVKKTATLRFYVELDDDDDADDGAYAIGCVYLTY